MSKKSVKLPAIVRPPETFNYLGKFTLNKGDLVKVQSQSYYIDAAGVKHRAGVHGIYKFVCAVNSGILVRENNSQTTIFVFLGEERKLELTGTILKPHILKLPTVKRKKKHAVRHSTKS